MSMLRSMVERGERRPVRLIYGNRDWDGTAFREELLELKHRMDFEVTHVLSEPPEGWHDEVGVPRQELIGRTLDTLPEGVHAFLCGPRAMSRIAEDALRDAGVPGARIHLELFEMA